MALVMMNLNRFTQIDDTVGYDRGDELLQHVGRRLREVIFDRDIVAHFGGDEFAVLLLDTANATAIDGVVHKIVAALASPFPITGLPILIE